MPASEKMKKLLREIKEMTLLNYFYPQLKNIHKHVYRMLEHASERDVKKFDEALDYLDRIRVVETFPSKASSKTIAELIAHRLNTPLDPKLVVNDPAQVKINANQLDDVLKLYLLINDFRNNIIIWKYNYPLNDHQEIDNDVITDWKAIMLKPSYAGEKIVDGDFMRNWTILGQSASSQEDFYRLVGEMLNKTSYTQEEKDSLKEWLIHRGGQANLGFVQELVSQVDFMSGFRGGKGQSEFANWEVVNDKIYLQYAFNFLTLTTADDRILSINYDGEKKLSEDFNDVKSEIEAGKLSPLLHFRVKIQLSVENNKPSLKVIHLQTVNFFDELPKPGVSSSPSPKK